MKEERIRKRGLLIFLLSWISTSSFALDIWDYHDLIRIMCDSLSIVSCFRFVRDTLDTNVVWWSKIDTSGNLIRMITCDETETLFVSTNPTHIDSATFADTAEYARDSDKLDGYHSDRFVDTTNSHQTKDGALTLGDSLMTPKTKTNTIESYDTNYTELPVIQLARVDSDEVVNNPQEGFMFVDTTDSSVVLSVSHKICTLKVASGGTDTNYPFKVTVDYDSDMDSSFKDIFWMDETQTDTLYCWQQEYVSGDSAVFYVREDDSITTTPSICYMFFKSTPCSARWNGDSTFLFFDDFSQGIDWTNKWQATDHSEYDTVTFDGDIRLHFPSAAASFTDALYNQYSSTANNELTVNFYWTGTGNQSYIPCLTNAIPRGASNEIDLGKANGRLIRYRDTGGSTPTIISNIDTLNWYRFKQTKQGTNTWNFLVYDIDGDSVFHDTTLTDVNASSNCYFTFLRYGGSDAYIDNIFVRPAHNPEPTTSFSTKFSGGTYYYSTAKVVLDDTARTFLTKDRADVRYYNTGEKVDSAVQADTALSMAGSDVVGDVSGANNADSLGGEPASDYFKTDRNDSTSHTIYVGGMIGDSLIVGGGSHLKFLKLGEGTITASATADTVVDSDFSTNTHFFITFNQSISNIGEWYVIEGKEDTLILNITNAQILNRNYNWMAIEY